MQTLKSRSIVALSALATLTLVACLDTVEPFTANAAVLTVVFDAHPEDTLQTLITDSTAILAAEAYLTTGDGPHLVTGQIVRGAGLDARYPFRYLPETVRLVEAAIELCDAAPMRTSAAVDSFFQGSTGSVASDTATWCPWGSRPIWIEPVHIGN